MILIILCLAELIGALLVCFACLIMWPAYVQERTRQDAPWGKHWGNWS